MPSASNLSRALNVLYHTLPGRLLLKPLTSRGLSQAAGRFLSSPWSLPLAQPFVAKNNIPLEDFQSSGFDCFNDCFCRKIRPGLRPIDQRPEALIAPCDGLLTVYPIQEGTVFPIKQSRYTVASLLGQPPEAPLPRRYQNGVCLVFRLCVHHYHRYCYVDSGYKGENHFLSGKLHTVQPVALAQGPVFSENCREYTLVKTRCFGPVVQMEVGAMLVGRIYNYHGPGAVTRGEEKGRFLYGGSTVILLMEQDRASLFPAFLSASAQGRETPVKMGQAIGSALTKAPPFSPCKDC